MTNNQIAQSYLADLAIDNRSLDITFLNELQSKHIAQYSFNNVAVLLGQELPLDIESLFNKIVEKRRGGYCFEHNKLVFTVLSELGFDVRLLLSKVIYNQDIEVARTHRVTLLTLAGEDYIVDAGFGHLGARFPVKITLGLIQDQGDAKYRIIKNAKDDYCYQVVKDGDFFTLYTFDLHHYTESDCLLGHFYSHKHPNAAFVNNLVICRKFFNDIQSLRNNEFHHVKEGISQTTKITSFEQLHQLLIKVYQLDFDVAISEFLFHKFVAPKAA
ncbi:arylamine N-acetyltransferase family protein [Colwellia psychrerythraea]|uniref:N-acetyltransferase n=1 Tax=Colwellia psychrerythraea TaxID=28229 RepID=A0A099KEG5_COLPS|nr:arylamine N-acetyltransferase [Colwellia psychrerythraea]KGJ88670.1 N-acetyltransferase [Colwellia psychrerythraea]